MQEPREVSAKNDTKNTKGRVQELKIKSNKERKYSSHNIQTHTLVECACG
jgi:hypothetical protein